MKSGLLIHMYYAEGQAYWLLGHLEEFASFERADRQLDEWSNISRGRGAVGFTIYIDGDLVYDGAYDLRVTPANLRRQVNLFLEELNTEDAAILLGVLSEQNPKEYKHGYIDPDTGAMISKRLFDEGYYATREMSAPIVEDPNTVDDINQALLGGTLGIGSHGLVTATSRERIDTGEGEPEAARTRHHADVHRQQEARREQELRREAERGSTEQQRQRAIEWLTERYGPHQGLNADWVGMAWPISSDKWVVDEESEDSDGYPLYAVVRRVEIDDGYNDNTLIVDTFDGIREFIEGDVEVAHLQLSPERLRELSISHGLDHGGYEYENVRRDWIRPLADADITNVVEIEADTFANEVMGGATDFFGINIHSLELPIVLFEPCGVYTGTTASWPTVLSGGPGSLSRGPDSFVLVIDGILNEFETGCICEPEDSERENCTRCEGTGYVTHEGGRWALYKWVEGAEIEEEDGDGESEGEYEHRNVASLGMSGRPGRLVNTPDDMAWLRETHLPNLHARYQSAMIYGNEDSPDQIECYYTTDPELTDGVQIWVRKEDEEEESEESTGREPVSEETYNSNRRIVTTYEIVTEESAADGDVAESGFEDEEGYEIIGEPGYGRQNQYVADAVKFLKDNGANEPSSSWFHTGIWYTQSEAEFDRRTGGELRRSYHLEEFSPEEEAAIFKCIKGIEDKFEVHYTEQGLDIRNHDRRIQLYNNGIDTVVALLVIDSDEARFTVFDGDGNVIYEGTLHVLESNRSGDEVLQTIITGMIDRPLIAVGMNRDYLDMLGENIPFVEF